MTKFAFVPAVIAVIVFSACEPTFVDVTFDGVPKCEGTRLSSEIVLKIEGPRLSFFQVIKGDGAEVSTKMVAGKLYKLKAYQCVSEPCENEKNFFHGADITAPEKSGSVKLELPGAPGCKSLAPPPAAPAEDGGTTGPDAG